MAQAFETVSAKGALQDVAIGGAVKQCAPLLQLADSIRTDGCPQPIRVRATDDDDYVLIAGERRYRAAVKACVMELPAIIRPADTGDEEAPAK